MMEEDDREAWEAEIETDVVLQTRIAGHAGIIAKRQYLFKPVQPPYRNEEKVYTKFQDKFPDVLPFIPKFYGVKTRGENSFLVLENLLDKCKKPAFMDLKVGKSLHYREDPLREGVYNLLGLFIHGVSSSFLKLKNRVNEYRGRQVTIDDFDAIIRLFFRMMGPSQEMVDRIKKMIKIIKSMDGVRFYGTSLFIAFDEDESSDFQPSLHMIDFERAKVDAESDGSACLSQEEVAKIFKISKNVQRVVGETDKIQGSGGGPSSVPPRNDTDQQSVDTSLLQETGPDLYILRSLKHLLTIVQEEWSQEEHVRFNPGYNPHVIWRQSRSQDNGILHPQKPLPRRPILVYMVRHGERYDYTDVSWAKQAAYPHDSHLSPIGETQAQDLADRLANARPAMIVASPFQRAILSAIPLARRLRIPVCVEPGLAEFLCKDTRTKIPGFFSSEVSISPWVDINYKPFWPKLKLESWPEMRQRVAVTASHLIKQCQEMGGDLIICSHRSTLTAVFEWLDVSKHPNARLEYGAVAVLARKEWELLDEDVKPDSNSEKYKILDGDSEEVKVEKNGLSECSGWTAISFNEVQHLRNHIQSPSSNPFRHIEGYYEDLSWTNYKKTPVAPLIAPPQSLANLTDPTSAPPSTLNSSNPDAAPKAN